jgi:threonylcarbamoyladenosine tRNA methylthiotransferase MtaB
MKNIPLNLIKGFQGYSRAFVQVQQGCDHRCTFCIIPFARGSNRSLPFSEICKQVKILVAHGYKEVVLTGVDICSYGMDLVGQPQLGTLIKDLLAHVPDLPRLRLSSIDPAIIDPLFFEVLRDEERLMPHLHLSLQAMDPMVLKRMGRRHSVKQVLKLAEDMREIRPDIVFGADIIAGFPTETEQMFRNSVQGIKELGITYLHVFPYSERPGTPATRMPKVEKRIRKQRAAIMRKIGVQSKRSFFNSLIGKNLEVLTDTNDRGLTKQFVPV